MSQGSFVFLKKSFLVLALLSLSFVPTVHTEAESFHSSASSLPLLFGDDGMQIRMTALVSSVNLRSSSEISPEDVFMPTFVPTVDTVSASAPSVIVDAASDTTSPTTFNSSLSALVRLDDDAKATLTIGQESSYKNLVVTTISKFPPRFYASLKEIVLKGSTQGSRGLANRQTLIIQVNGLPDEEVAAVSVHELGHVVDGGMLTGSSSVKSNFQDGSKLLPVDDASVVFYTISWKNEKEVNEANPENFVSGYAMENPYEDFAETFGYYVLHGDDFKGIAKFNKALQKKYDFMKNNVFEGQEFVKTEKKVSELPTTIPWDSTKLVYNFSAFVGS